MIEFIKDPKQVSNETAVKYLETVIFSTLPAALKAEEDIKDVSGRSI